ncbi:MAG: NAD(P)/FAD-dependent oxidoreductase [Bacteroidales bacterium]
MEQSNFKVYSMECCEKISCPEEGRSCVPHTDLPRIVIVGGGFAGLNLIKGLKDMPVQIILIDKNNFHQFLLLFYQVATSGIEPDNIIFPFRKMFNHYRNLVFRMAEALKIDSANNRLHTTLGYIDYDYLVLAGGSKTNFFENQRFKDNGMGLKSITDALDIRSKLLQNLEKAAVNCTTEEKELFSSVVIVGGGPAGVETAGALAEFKKHILPKDYPELKQEDMNIYLVEAADRLLGFMPEKLSEKTRQYLTGVGIDVWLNSPIKDYDGFNAYLENGKILKSSNFIWTAGVKGISVEGLPADAVNRQNRIMVDAYNHVHSLPNVYVIGDLALMQTTKYPNGHPLVAQVAIQQGKNLAVNLWKMMNKEQLVPFEYRDKGSMATIGRRKAVASIQKMQFAGFFAWLIWSFIHLISLMGVRNKILVGINWLWNYLTYDRGNRLIIRKFEEKKKEEHFLFKN